MLTSTKDFPVQLPPFGVMLQEYGTKLPGSADLHGEYEGILIWLLINNRGTGEFAKKGLAYGVSTVCYTIYVHYLSIPLQTNHFATSTEPFREFPCMLSFYIYFV